MTLSYVVGVVSVVCIMVMCLVIIRPTQVRDDEVSACPQFLRAHHSAITNTHRFLYYCLAMIPHNPFGIPKGLDNSKWPAADEVAVVTIGEYKSTIPFVSEFDRIISYLYGLTSTPYTEAIYGDAFGLPPGARISECVIRVSRPSHYDVFVEFSGIVLPADLREVSIKTPFATYTLNVTGMSRQTSPILRNGILRWNQGDLGSCAAVSASSLIYNATGEAVSPLAIYWHARGGLPVDTGTTFDRIVHAVSTHGVVDEREFPYDPSAYTVRPPSGHQTQCQLVIVKTAAEATRYLDMGIPVALATTLSTSALGQATLWTGDIPISGSRTTGHVVVAVGYYRGGFIVDMNWETWWGMKGLGMLPEAYFEEGLVALGVTKS